jgi:hypothetical protein
MANEETVGAVRTLAHAAREIAIAGAAAGVDAVLRDLLSLVDEDEGRPIGILSQDPEHAGTPARRIDALAQAAAKDGAERKWLELKQALAGQVQNVVYVGEESGAQTQLILPRTLVIRFDPLDGTTNAINILNSFASVVSVDVITNTNGEARHLAGAILGGEVDVSWIHWSRRGQHSVGYSKPLGRVFVRSMRIETGWRHLEVSQEERDVHSVASVAANSRRFTAFGPFRDEIFANGGVVYHSAGNPFCAALLLGHVGAFVETQNVTMHDSVYLIPHWLLGGRIETLDYQPFDYIGQYERHAVDFSPRSKPIPPYIAYVGASNPLKDRKIASELRNSGEVKSPPRRQVFREED